MGYRSDAYITWDVPAFVCPVSRGCNYTVSFILYFVLFYFALIYAHQILGVTLFCRDIITHTGSHCPGNSLMSLSDETWPSATGVYRRRWTTFWVTAQWISQWGITLGGSQTTCPGNCLMSLSAGTPTWGQSDILPWVYLTRLHSKGRLKLVSVTARWVSLVKHHSYRKSDNLSR